MSDYAPSPQRSDSVPKPGDGFHEPSEDTKKRNITTGLIIAGVVLLWILDGLREPLLGLVVGMILPPIG